MLVVFRVLRLARVLRLLKLAHFTKSASQLLSLLTDSWRKITVFLVTFTSLTVIVGAVMYTIEGAHSGFTSIPQVCGVRARVVAAVWCRHARSLACMVVVVRGGGTTVCDPGHVLVRCSRGTVDCLCARLTIVVACAVVCRAIVTLTTVGKCVGKASPCVVAVCGVRLCVWLLACVSVCGC